VIGSGKWKIKITADVPDPKQVPASFSGEWGLNTAPVHLSGNYTVTYRHAGSGNFIASLEPVDGDVFGGESIANEIGRVNSSTEAYNLEGDYFLDVVADGDWTIKIEVQ
jgi:hypothetical protein